MYFGVLEVSWTGHCDAVDPLSNYTLNTLHCSRVQNDEMQLGVFQCSVVKCISVQFTSNPSR